VTDTVRRADTVPPPDWASFLAEHSERITRAVERVCRDVDEAADVGAEVLEHLRRDWPALLERYRPAAAGNFGAWLSVVARNAAIDSLRRRHGRSRAQPEITPRPDVDPEDDADPSLPLTRRSAGAALARVFRDLSGDERTLLRLYFLEGRDAETLRRMFGGRTRSQVYNRVHELTRRLGEAVRRAGLESSDIEHLAPLDWGRVLRNSEQGEPGA